MEKSAIRAFIFEDDNLFNERWRRSSAKLGNKADYGEVTTQLYWGCFVVVVVVVDIIVVVLNFVAVHIGFSYLQGVPKKKVD